MKNIIKSNLGVVMIALLTSLVTIFVYNRVSNNSATGSNTGNTIVPKVDVKMPVTPAISTDFTVAAEKAIPAVVHVTVKAIVEGYSNNPFDFFFGPENYKRQYPVSGSGSGVIISSDGYIITNNHVVEKSDEIQVILNDKRKFEAKVIGTDPATDLALIKIEAKDLPVLDFGNSDDLKVGEWVLAVGNPFNLSTTVTAGIVSAKARGIGILGDKSEVSGKEIRIESFIQTDAAVNPGNSGGALVDTNGKLVGINTAIASPTGTYAGYSFAVPVTIVKKVVADIIEFGEVQRALLGVQIADISAELAKEKGIKELNGVYVYSVYENSTASDAGIKDDDIILTIDAIQVNSVSQLQETVSKYRPGDKATISFMRNGIKKSVVATFKNKWGSVTTGKSEMSLLGASLQELTKDELKKYGLSYGIQVTGLEAGKLLAAGVKEGYIITKINDTRITSVTEYVKVVKNANSALFITGLYPNGRWAYYAINMESK